MPRFLMSSSWHKSKAEDDVGLCFFTYCSEPYPIIFMHTLLWCVVTAVKAHAWLWSCSHLESFFQSQGRRNLTLLSSNWGESEMQDISIAPTIAGLPLPAM